MFDLDYLPQLPLDVAFWFTSLVLLMIAIGGVLRYRTAFNPLVLFVIFEGLFQTLLSALIAFTSQTARAHDIANTLILSTVYFVGMAIVFLPVRVVGVRVLINRWLLSAKLIVPSAIRGRKYHLLFVAIAFAAVFLALMVASGAGTLWITNPRMAYQGFRAGSGFLFLLVQWISVSGLLIYLFGKTQTTSSSLWALIVYAAIANFTGSKSALVSGLFLWITFYNFYVRKISVIWFFVAIVFCIPLMLGRLVAQGSYGDLMEALDYFKDYVATTAVFLGRFDEFGFRYGSASLSDLWFYVPRVIYPAKPFEYGLTLIHQVLYPGMAELGHTPGILPWSLAFLDFGVLGVFFVGVIGGSIKRLAYEFFLDRPYSVFSFVLVMQLALVPVYIYASLPLSILIAFVLHRYTKIGITGFQGRVV